MTHARTSATLLPHLLYLGDVPVEDSVHGSALLYRLLQGYPLEKLLVMETSTLRSRREHRLKDISYTTLGRMGDRLLNTRLHPMVSACYLLSSKLRANSVAGIAGKFTPQAVLTVAHGWAWLTAARYSHRNRIPLHLMVHDDWVRVSGLPSFLSKRQESLFGEIYRQAATRFCVSPYMAEEYERRYGARALILYPSRSRSVRPRAVQTGPGQIKPDKFTVAFAGTLNSSGYVSVLRRVAECLETIGGRLALFGPISREIAERQGLTTSNVIYNGFVPQARLLERLVNEADVLLVPMSFDPAEATNMALAFPSKLTDYTAVGVPILIHGPPACSAVRWAREYEGVAAVVDTANGATLRDTLLRLKNDRGWRVDLATKAARIGDRLFSHESAEQILFDAIASA